MSKEDVKKQSLTIRLEDGQSKWLDQWTRKTGQPASLVVRAGVNLLLAALRDKDLARAVTTIADLGAADGVPDGSLAAMMIDAVRQGMPDRSDKTSGRRRA